MRAARHGGGWLIPAFAVVFYAGIAIGWWLHGRATPEPSVAQERVDLPIPTTGDDRSAADAAPTGDLVESTNPRLLPDPIAELNARSLRVPIEGARIEVMKGGFGERRGGGARAHEAVDILAPRHTPVRAAEGGTIARLLTSRAGGLSVYQFDPERRFCYYYAHLASYARDLREGQHVAAGDVIGYVGTTGNAPPNTPHLHFAIFELTPDGRWWEGKALDPYLVYR